MGSEKDRERAIRWGIDVLEPIASQPESPDNDRAIVDALAEEFAAVKAEERAAIVAWLHREAEDGDLAMEDIWNAIERGDHTPAKGEGT